MMTLLLNQSSTTAILIKETSHVVKLLPDLVLCEEEHGYEQQRAIMS